MRTVSLCLITLAILCLSATNLSIFGGHSSTAVSTGPQTGGTAIIATVYDDTKGLNPLVTTASYVLSNLYDKLINYDSHYNLVPDLAQNWTISADQKTFTFHLFQNVTWSDGVPFTAADVQWYFQTVASGSAYAYYSVLNKTLTSITTPNNYTVVFNFNTPTLPGIFANQRYQSFIAPKHIYQGTNIASNPANLKPVGTGPFTFVEYVSGSHLTLAANTHYFRGRPYLDKIIFEFIPNPQTALAAYQSGSVNILDSSEGSNLYPSLGSLNSTSGTLVFPLPGVSVTSLFFNFGANSTKSNPWVNNTLVRQAIGYAINKTALINSIYFGFAQVDWAPLAPANWGYDSNLTRLSYNVTKANSLLDQAGYKKGSGGVRFTATMAVPVGGEVELLAEGVQAQLSQVGITIQLSITDATTYAGLYFGPSRLGSIPLTLVSLGGNLAQDPDGLRQTYNCNSSSFFHIGFYCDPKVDALLASASTLPSQAQRLALYDQAEVLMDQDVPAIWMDTVSQPVIASTSYHNLQSLFPDVFSISWNQVWYSSPQATTSSQGPGTTLTQTATQSVTQTATQSVTQTATQSVTQTAIQTTATTFTQTAATTLTQLSGTTVTQTASSSGSSNTALIVGAVIVIAIIIAAAVVLMRRRPA